MTPSARLLDITRLSSRIGRVFTGVDRVELAYLRAVTADAVPCFALGRTALGYVLLDRDGMALLLQRIDEQDWPSPDFVSRINNRLDQSAKVGQTLLRQLAIARCIRSGLAKLLRAHLPAHFAYLNVGHSNLTARTLSAISGLDDVSITVLVHDAIPLDFPEYQRPGTVAQFEAKLRRVSAFADRIICVSQAGIDTVRPHLERFGRVPQMAAAHLGVDVNPPGTIPPHVTIDRPYFVTVGTIEPRKNHALLLDIWESFGTSPPQLIICGGQGWRNEDVRRKLDQGVPGVSVYNDLPDGVLSAVIADAQALLFPTFAEGFGLPPQEALGLGTPVICSDLPVLQETLGSHAIYCDPTDADQWISAIKRLAAADGSQGNRKFTPPTWEAHFKIVFTMT